MDVRFVADAVVFCAELNAGKVDDVHGCADASLRWVSEPACVVYGCAVHEKRREAVDYLASAMGMPGLLRLYRRGRTEQGTGLCLTCVMCAITILGGYRDSLFSPANGLIEYGRRCQ